jgi:PAS domain S-box-containing protein
VFKDNALCHSLIQHSSDVITILNTNGIILCESPSIERLFGYKPDELIGKNAFNLVHPEDLPKVINAFMQVLRTPQSYLSIEYRFRHKDSSWRVVESTGSNQLNDKLIAGIVINTRDVTERRVHEELLKQAVKCAEDEKAKSDAILAAIGDGISIQNADFKVSYQNEAHKNIVEGDKSGEYCYSAYAKNDRVCTGCPLAFSLEDGKVHTLEKSALRDKGLIYVEIKASPISDSEGNIIGGVEVVRDVTERRLMEERLQESEERFRRIFDDGPLGIIICDPNYRIIKANKAFCQMLGYSEGEFIGHTVEEFTYPEDIEKSATLSNQALQGEIPLFRLEKRYVKKNRDSLWINLTATVIRDREGKVLYAIGLIDDISQRKAAELEREQLISQLKEAVANIKTLTGLIPMCAWCKKIRDDKGYWNRVEVYVKEHSDASFTHGICPTCLQKEDRLTFEEVLADENRASGIKIEKRLFERLRLRKPLACAFGVQDNVLEKTILNAAIEDISEAGMCINTNYPMEYNVVLTSNSEAKDKIGIVRWRELLPTKNDSYRVGIRFIQN